MKKFFENFSVKSSIQFTFCMIAIITLSVGPFSIPKLYHKYVEVKTLVNDTRTVASQTEEIQNSLNKNASALLKKDHVVAVLNTLTGVDKIELGNIEDKTFKAQIAVKSVKDIYDCGDKYNAVRITCESENVTSMLEQVSKLDLLKNSIAVNFDQGTVTLTVYMNTLGEEER